MTRRRRGLSLGMVLILAMLMILMGFTIAEISTFQLQVAEHTRYSAEALEMAEGAVAQTLEQLHTHIPDVGTALKASPTPILPLPTAYGLNQEQIQFPANAADTDPWGRVAFNPANTYGVNGTCLPYSTANCNGKNTTGYQGSSIPTGGYDVLATGQSHGVMRTVEVLITIPTFPYAIASAGPLTVKGDLLVVGVHNLQQAICLLCNGQTSQFINQVANDTTYDPQVFLTTVGQALTTGIPIPVAYPHMSPPQPMVQPASIYAGGGMTFDSALTVNGDVVWSGTTAPTLPTGSVVSPFPVVSGKVVNAAIALPTIPPFDATQVPVGSISDAEIGEGAPMLSPAYNYPNTSSPVVINGDLDLQSNLVYIDGDITINGVVMGLGAIIATGTITITYDSADRWDAASATTDENVTLIGDKGVTISGAGGRPFKGFIYSRGNINLSNLYVLGAIIGEPGTNAQVNLTDVTVVYTPPGPGQSVCGTDLFMGVYTNPADRTSLPPGDFYANQTAQTTAQPPLLETTAALSTLYNYPLATSIPSPTPNPLLYTDISGAFDVALGDNLYKTPNTRALAFGQTVAGNATYNDINPAPTLGGLGVPSLSNPQRLPTENFGGYYYNELGANGTITVYDIYYDSTHNACLLSTPDVVTLTNGFTQYVGTSDCSHLTAALAPSVAAIDTAFFRAWQTTLCIQANAMLQPYPATVKPFTYMNPDPVVFLPDAPALSITAWREK